jgi:hypothetical protein
MRRLWIITPNPDVITYISLADQSSLAAGENDTPEQQFGLDLLSLKAFGHFPASSS